MTDVKDRVDAIRMIGKLLATSKGRQMFVENGYVSGQAIIAAHYDETIQDVLPRIRSCKPPVTVALIKEGDLFLFTLQPSRRGSLNGDHHLDGVTNADPRSTIGMLYEAIAQQDGTSTFKITEWDSETTALSMPDVRPLLHMHS